MAHREQTEAIGHSGGVVIDGIVARTKQLEKPASSRREIGGARQAV
jgi:hypothetical protein